VGGRRWSSQTVVSAAESKGETTSGQASLPDEAGTADYA
jgi:hypothetical protein